jgi:hypothetical protein
VRREGLAIWAEAAPDRACHGPRVHNRAVMSPNASTCGRWAANESLILVFNSLIRRAIFTNVHRIVSNVAPRQRDFFGRSQGRFASFGIVGSFCVHVVLLSIRCRQINGIRQAPKGNEG